MKPTKKRILDSPSTLIISFSQTLAARLFRIFIKLVGDFEIRSMAHFEPDKTYLVISNHASKLDPFAIFGTRSLKDNLHTAPIRFLTSKKEYYSVLYLWLKSVGCYPTKNRKLTVPETVDLLCNGWSVVIFPEGKRTSRETSDPRDGTKMILEEIKRQDIKIEVMLTHIDWRRKGLRRRLAIGSMLASKDVYDKSMKQIMNDVYEV